MMTLLHDGRKLPVIGFLLVCAVIFLPLAPPGAVAKNQKHETKVQKEKPVYSDEYSELDDVRTPNSTKDEVVLKTLEKSRQKYLQALILVEKGDTLTAAKYFEDAIDILNKLTSYPDIEQNEDFTDLAQSIIEDYESYIQSIDNLDINTSFFIIREKLFQEVETSAPNVTKIQPLDLNKDTLAKAGMPNVPVVQDRHSIPLVDNDLVQKHIAFFTRDKGKKYMKKWIERSTRWFPMMKSMAEEEDMPEEIIYLSMIESGLNPTIVSRAKAVGLWQFIRSTGELYGLNKNFSLWLDERRDPEKATRAAMRHLSDLFNELHDWHLALAAYNCGINGVRRAMAKSGIENPNFWDISPYLPRETRNYVPLYIATAKIATKPEAYGFNKNEFQYEPEYAYETYKLTEPVSIKALAKCAGVPYETLQNLNPELIASFTPPDATEYTLKLPPGTRQGFIANYALLSQEEKQPWVNHTVHRGETLHSIAESYGISENAIIAANSKVSFKGKLRRGTPLRIPVDSKEAAQVQDNLAANAEQDNTTADNTKEVTKDNTTASSVSNVSDRKIDLPAKKDAPVKKSTVKENSNYITHVVKKGETLYNISQRYSVRLADIRNMNDIPYDEDNIEAGRKLKIAVNGNTKAEKDEAETGTFVSYSPTPKIIKHTVHAGETLAQIADDYNVSIESIRELNKVRNNIQAGQILKIRTEKSSAKMAAAAVTKASTRTQSAYEAAEKHSSSAVQKLVTHKVKRGENLSMIAAKYGVTETDLKKWNKGQIRGKEVYYGTKLKIYEDQVQKGSSTASSKKVNKLPKTYKVHKGDNLSDIADKFGVTVKALKKKNKNLSEKSLKVGQKISIP